MKIRILLLLFCFTATGFAQLFPDLGGQRNGTAAAQFLKIGVGARSLGMGEAYTAISNDAEALYWNPAGMVLNNKNSVILSRVDWLVDVKLDFAGIIYHLDADNVLGAAVTYLHTDEMNETTELHPFGTGRTFTFSDFLFGLSYARSLTDQFSFGVTAKYMQETVFDLSMRSLLFDLGTYYATGFNSIRFAMVVSNFGEDMKMSGDLKTKTLDNEVKTISDFQAFPPPTVLRIGIAAEVYEAENHVVTTSVQLNHPNDNRENLNIGVEYNFYKKFFLRSGYKTGRKEENFSFGVGFYLPTSLSDLQVDYALTNFGRLGYVNRFALQLLF
jgi:hypothetical protein